jgi:hypothetical protein
MQDKGKQPLKLHLSSDATIFRLAETTAESPNDQTGITHKKSTTGLVTKSATANALTPKW